MPGSRKRLAILLRKELAELARERVVLFGLLLGPFIMYIVFGGMAAASMQGIAREAGRPLTVAVLVNGDIDENVSRLVEELNAAGLRVGKVVSDGNASTLLSEGFDTIIIINSSSLASLLRTGERLNTIIIMNIKIPSFVSVQLHSRVQNILEEALRTLLSEKIRSCLPKIEPSTLQEPAETTVVFYYKGRLVPAQAFMASLFGAMIIIPMALLIVVLAATQVASVSLGIEKEARTLEKLLSMPISFSNIITAKVLAIAVLSLGGVASNILGLLVYIALIERVAAASDAAESTGFGLVRAPMLSPGDVALLIIGLLATLYITILIGLIIGSASDDIRSSQLSASYAGFILALPLFMVFFGLNPTALSGVSKALLSLDPYFLLAVMTVASITGSTSTSILALAGLAAHIVGWTLLSRVVLTPENILLGQPSLKRLASRLRRAHA